MTAREGMKKMELEKKKETEEEKEKEKRKKGKKEKRKKEKKERINGLLTFLTDPNLPLTKVKAQGELGPH
jgi:hypothetical protein